MLIDFDSLDEVSIPNFNGGDGETVARMTVIDGNRVLRGRLPPGSSIGTHTHSGSCEFILIVSGHGITVCDGEEEHLSAGMCHYCADGHSHSLRNDGPEDLEFFAVVPRQ